MYNYTYREYVWNWICRYPLWYLGVLVANLVAMVVLFPYRLFNEYILNRKVDLGGWAFALYQFTDAAHYRTQPLYKPVETAYDIKCDLCDLDINSSYPSTITTIKEKEKEKEDGDI